MLGCSDCAVFYVCMLAAYMSEFERGVYAELSQFQLSSSVDQAALR